MAKNERRKNKDWKKRWLNVVKHDQDWDWVYFMEIILHKLELVKERWESGAVLVCEEERNQILERVNHLLLLGREIISADGQADRFSLWAASIYEQHSHNLIKEDAGRRTYGISWDEKDGDPEGWKKEFEALMRKSDEYKDKLMKDFFEELGDTMYRLWD